MTPPDLLGVDSTRRLTAGSKQVVAKDFAPRSEVISAAPSYVSGVTATYRRPVFNGESPALLTARSKIARARAGVADCEILVMGDSKSAPFMGAVVSWPEQFRLMTAGVDGFVQADDGVMDPRWSHSGMVIETHSKPGLKVAATGTLPRSVTFTSTEPFTGAALLVATGAAGDVKITVDGVESTRSITGTGEFTRFDLGALSDTPHAVKVEATSADLYVGGIDLDYETPNLIASNPARPASAATDWAATGARTRWNTFVTAGLPDVFMVALGANDSTNLSALTLLFNNLAATGRPVIIVSPGAIDASRGQTVTNALANHLYGIAQSKNWPLIDMAEVVGAYTAANTAGLMYDNLHENTRGMSLEARAVYDALA